MEMDSTISAEQADHVESAAGQTPLAQRNPLTEAKAIIIRHTRLQVREDMELKQLAIEEKQVRSDLHYARLRVTMKNRTIRRMTKGLADAQEILARSRIEEEVALRKMQDIRARRALKERDIQMDVFREVFPVPFKQ